MIKSIQKLSIAFLPLFISGCAGESVKIVTLADTGMGKGNYCKALDLYKKALSMDPDLKNDQKITTNSFFAMKECAKNTYNEGIEFLEAAKYDDAIRQFRMTLQIDPEHKKARHSLEEALNRKDTRLMTTEDLYRDGLKAMQNKNWQVALTQFKRLLELDKNHPHARQKIEEIQQIVKKTDDVLAPALALFEAKKWEEAVQAFDKVLAVDPAHSTAQEKKLFAQGELSAAEELYKKGVEASRKNNDREAMRFLAESLRKSPDHRQAREAAAKLYLRAAEQHESRGNPGNAALSLKKAVSFNQGLQDAAKKLSGLEEEIRLRASFSLALLPFKEYGRDPELSENMYASMRKKMESENNGFVRIVDNKVVEKVLQEKDIPIEKAGDGKNAVLLKEVPKLNAVLTGKVVSFKVSSERNVEKKSKQYQSGTNRKRNPAYDVALQNAKLAEVAAKQARSAAKEAFGFWGGIIADVAGGAVEVSQNVELAKTPEYLEEPIYGTWHYKVVTHRKKGELVTAFRLVDSQTGELLAEESIPAEVSFSGETIENPNPTIGIPEKSLPAEMDTDMREPVIAKATEVITTKLDPFLQKYAYRYYSAGKKFASEENRVQAVESYQNFIYTVSQDNKAVENEIKIVREYLDSVDLWPN